MCTHRVQGKAFTTSSELQAGALKVLDAIRDRHAVALLSDNRRLEGITDPDQLWLRDFWTPLAVNAGIKRIAVVVAPRGLGRIATEETIGRLGKTEFITRTFDSPAAALQWIVGG